MFRDISTIPRVYNTATCAGRRCGLGLTFKQKGGERERGKKNPQRLQIQLSLLPGTTGGFVRDMSSAAGHVGVSEAFCECGCQAVKAAYPALSKGVLKSSEQMLSLLTPYSSLQRKMVTRESHQDL